METGSLTATLTEWNLLDQLGRFAKVSKDASLHQTIRLHTPQALVGEQGLKHAPDLAALAKEGLSVGQARHVQVSRFTLNWEDPSIPAGLKARQASIEAKLNHHEVPDFWSIYIDDMRGWGCTKEARPVYEWLAYQHYTYFGNIEAAMLFIPEVYSRYFQKEEPNYRQEVKQTFMSLRGENLRAAFAKTHGNAFDYLKETEDFLGTCYCYLKAYGHGYEGHVQLAQKHYDTYGNLKTAACLIPDVALNERKAFVAKHQK